MFEADLKGKFERIFDMRKTSFDLPGESTEQECVFIDIKKCKTTVKDGTAYYEVRGEGHVFAPNDKLPFGYFAKKIKAANPTDTKDVFFYDIEESAKVIQNIVRRSFSFVYFFRGQYNPELGNITSLTQTEV